MFPSQPKPRAMRFCSSLGFGRADIYFPAPLKREPIKENGRELYTCLTYLKCDTAAEARWRDGQLCRLRITQFEAARRLSIALVDSSPSLSRSLRAGEAAMRCLQ